MAAKGAKGGQATDGAYKWDKFQSMPTKRVFSTPVDVNGTLFVLGNDVPYSIFITFIIYNDKR